MHDILFHLLRLALGLPKGEAMDLSVLTKADWEALVDLAFDQGVAAFVVDGLGSTGSPTGLSDTNALLESDSLEDLRYELFGEALACEEDYRKRIEAIRSLVGCFSAQGLDTFALKGVAFAQYYPVPEHRYSCDFDCNVRSADGRPAWAEADRIARETGIEVDDSMNKHSRYVVSNVSVENHRNIISVNGSRKDKRFDAYLQGLLCASEKSLLSDVKLYSPCWLFNALFCVAHARTHFIEEEGITLKHVLDWALIRRAPEAATCREQFEKDIDRFGLRKFFDALDAVADVLELRAESLELREEGVWRMLEDILAPKEVRHYESRFLAHLNILRMLWTNRWKFRLYSDTSFLATVWRYVYGHWFDRG